MKSAYTNDRWIRGAEDYIAKSEDAILKAVEKSYKNSVKQSAHHHEESELLEFADLSNLAVA